MRTSIVGAALVGLSSTVHAAINQQCQNGICYSMNIPDSSTSSTGTVYFQITGPTSFAWIGMGTGSQMSGSNMFVIYQAANGQNVTLSPRKGSGHVMPSADNSLQATLLDGSGVVNGQMIANIKCGSCSTSNANFVFAANTGSLQSDSASASIQQHQNTYGTFSFNVNAAKGGSDTNPFTGSSSSTNSSSSSGSSGSGSGSGSNSGSGSGSSCQANSNGGNGNTQSSPTTTSSGFPFFGGTRPTGFPFQTGSISRRANNDDCSSGGFSQNGASISSLNMKLMAHGIMAGLCFAILFPFGAISIRLFSFPGLIWFHAGLQIVTQIIFIIAFALGVTIADDLKLMNSYHPIIGIVVFVLLIIQPVLGMQHHRAFKQLGRRTAWSHGHIWVGRIIIVLGIINGGLGFMLANNTSSGPIAYAVVAAIFFIVYVAATVIGERRRARSLPPKYEESPRGSGPTSPREFYGRQEYEMQRPS
jgi:hypothetical protein